MADSPVPKELARHHFVIVNTTASASLLLLYAYATGPLPPPPNNHFKQILRHVVPRLAGLNPKGPTP